MFAVVRTGGKQYRVQEGRLLRIDHIPGDPGESVELRDVLMMGDGDAVAIGTPSIDGARVIATIRAQGRAKKVVVFRYKAKTRSRKKTGHRQQYTELRIEDILAAGQEPKPKAAAVAPAEAPAEEKPKTRRRKAAAPAAEATAAAPEPEAAPAEPAAAEPAAAEPAAETPKPKRSRKKTE